MISFLKSNIVFFLLGLTSLFGQIKVHKHLTTDDGLVDNKILSIFQDSKGYIWFGTFGGVSKWDGNNFENFTKENGLPSSAVLGITETHKGNILFSIYGKGFVTFNDKIIDTMNISDGLVMC